MKHSLEAGAGDLAMPDLMKIGGISGWMAAARLAQRHGRPVSSHLFQEASAHALTATPTAHFLEVLDVARPVLREPLQLRDGKARVLDAPPGSGVEWNHVAVERYRV
jgi:mandelate racemase